MQCIGGLIHHGCLLPKATMGDKFNTKVPFTTRFISHENEERMRVQALGLTSTAQDFVQNFGWLFLPLGDSCVVCLKGER